jgi:hypothetical protein
MTPIIRLTCALSLLFASAKAGQAGDAEKWKYAGEDHGIRFFFAAGEECREGPLLLKFENMLSIPVTARFQVKDGDWMKSFEHPLAANQVDSTIVDRPADREALCHPDVGRVSLDIPEINPLERYSATIR